MNDLITIVGCGALGSHVVQFARNLETSIKVIDMDRVEGKNTLSQFHGKTGLGKNKTSSIQQLMNFLFTKKIEIVPHKIVERNAGELLLGSKVVVDCLDNGEGRRVIQKFVREHSIPCLHGALAPNGEFGRVIWDEQFQIDDEAGAGAATCETGKFLPFIAITSAYIAESLRVFLKTGKKIGYQIHPAGSMKI